MKEIIETIDQYGVKFTVLIIALLFILWLIKSYIDKNIEKSFIKKTEKYKNDLNRSYEAFQFLLKKEMDYYKKSSQNFSILIPLIQDLYEDLNNPEVDKNVYKNNLLTFIQLIKDMKSDVLYYQCYIPKNIFNETSILINLMQKDLKEWRKQTLNLFESSPVQLNLEICNQSKEDILLQIAKINTITTKYLNELAKNEKQ